MPYSPKKHHRQSIRLPGHDYSSPGLYFVTICVRGGECLLGEVLCEKVRLTAFGRIAHDFWAEVSVHFAAVSIDPFTIMPNHVHAIIGIGQPTRVIRDVEDGNGIPRVPRDMPSPLQGGLDEFGREGAASTAEVPASAKQSTRQDPALGQILAYYKYQTTKQINELRDMPGTPIWQRNYWEHIIRSEASLNRIHEYVTNNPARWDEDQLHPEAVPNRFNRWQP